MSFKLVIGLLLLSSFHLSKAQLHGNPCGPHTHCNWGSGLVCEGENNHGRCACPNGTLTDTVSYSLVWDADRRVCVGEQGSACTGTRRTPVPAGLRAMLCADSLSCIQIPGQPSGIGSCQIIPSAQLQGAPCDQDNYCDSFRGLICINGNCDCAAENPRTFPTYDLFWDNQANKCLARVGTHCVGTRLFPSTHGEKAIECDQSADCVDEDMATPGIGICRSRIPHESTTTPTTTTTPGPNDPPTTVGGASTTSVVNFVTLITTIIAFTGMVKDV